MAIAVRHTPKISIKFAGVSVRKGRVFGTINRERGGGENRFENFDFESIFTLKDFVFVGLRWAVPRAESGHRL